MGIWALENQWFSSAVDLIHHNHGTFSEWSLSTPISVTETSVKVTNQRRQIQWLFVPLALSPFQRKKTAFVHWAIEHMYNWLLGQMQWSKIFCVYYQALCIWLLI